MAHEIKQVESALVVDQPWHGIPRVEAAAPQMDWKLLEQSDLDQNNPVDCSAEAWSDIFARHPDLLEFGNDYD